jgi:hypothetical protein
MAWRVLRLRMEEHPPILRVATNKLNKQSRTADEGWSSSLGLGEVLTTPLLKKHLLRTTHKCEMLPLETKQFGGKLLPTRIARGGGVSPEEGSGCRKRKRDILLGTWNFFLFT